MITFVLGIFCRGRNSSTKDNSNLSNSTQGQIYEEIHITSNPNKFDITDNAAYGHVQKF